jgi:hypothetical protein
MATTWWSGDRTTRRVDRHPRPDRQLRPDQLQWRNREPTRVPPALLATSAFHDAERARLTQIVPVS